MLSKFIRKHFFGGEWKISFRKNESKDFYRVSFSSLPHNNVYWFADPLLFKDGDANYLFVEAFNRNTCKGDIGFFTIKDEKISDFELLISQNYHMSYPLVFKYKNDYYMIPETGENRTIDLYKASNFPRGWIKDKTLISGHDYCDSTILEYENKLFLFSYSQTEGKYMNLVFELDMLTKTLKHIQTFYYNVNNGRGAGRMFIDEHNRIIRPAQDGEHGYGKSTIFYQLTISNGIFEEKIVDYIKNDSIVVDGKKGVDKMHTYSKTDDYEVIDYAYERFMWNKKISRLKRRIMKYKRHHK